MANKDIDTIMVSNTIRSSRHTILVDRKIMVEALKDLLIFLKLNSWDNSI